MDSSKKRKTGVENQNLSPIEHDINVSTDLYYVVNLEMKLRSENHAIYVGIRVRQIVSLGVINVVRPNIVSPASIHGEKYPDVSEKQFVKARPICCNTCNCKTCLSSGSHGKDQDYEKKTSDETSGLWRSFKVGVEVKGLLESVEHHYPDTFTIKKAGRWNGRVGRHMLNLTNVKHLRWKIGNHLVYLKGNGCNNVEFVRYLPFKDYTHLNYAYLNVADKLPELSSKPNMGPRMDIGYSNCDTKLHYNKADTVHMVSIPTNTTIVEQKHDEQDISKLEEYLRNHSTEFSSVVVVHPILDRSFYLNVEHKWRLKEEFRVEPFTFKQRLGDAVFIPAGCPYQVRNFQSFTKVELDFISPESLGECIRLQNELRLLPESHKAKQQKLNEKYQNL
nr:hypothetical protein [Tanacetum cinerariifolium]